MEPLGVIRGHNCRDLAVYETELSSAYSAITYSITDEMRLFTRWNYQQLDPFLDGRSVINVIQCYCLEVKVYDSAFLVCVAPSVYESFATSALSSLAFRGCAFNHGKSRLLLEKCGSVQG